MASIVGGRRIGTRGGHTEPSGGGAAGFGARTLTHPSWLAPYRSGKARARSMVQVPPPSHRLSSQQLQQVGKREGAFRGG